MQVCAETVKIIRNQFHKLIEYFRNLILELDKVGKEIGVGICRRYGTFALEYIKSAYFKQGCVSHKLFTQRSDGVMLVNSEFHIALTG